VQFYSGNGPKQAFTEATDSSGLGGVGARQASFADVNGDAKPDLLLDSLYLNNGSQFARCQAGIDLRQLDVLAVALMNVAGDSQPEALALERDGTLYIGSGLPLEKKPGTGAAVYALRTETDAQLHAKGLDRVVWKTSAPYGMVSPVTLADDLVIIGGGRNYWGFAVLDGQYGRPLEGVVMALDRKTGKILWKLKTKDSIWAPIAVQGGKAICSVGGQKEYSMTDRQRAELLALDVQSGRVLWRRTIGQGIPVLGGTVFTGDRVYALAADETLSILDADSGRIVKQPQLASSGTPVTEDMCPAGPLLVKGRLYVATQTGGLRCFGGTVPQSNKIRD